MSPVPRRRQGGYFDTAEDAPSPVEVRVRHRISFSETDPMCVLWHGHYVKLFEKANEALGHRCGMTYPRFFQERIKAPIVQLHVDYFASPVLDETVTTVGRLHWSDAARMNIEYQVFKEDGRLAASGYTVQMFIDENDQPLLAPPAMQVNCQQRWLAGEFHDDSAAPGRERGEIDELSPAPAPTAAADQEERQTSQ